jgi:hypothetical protein
MTELAHGYRVIVKFNDGTEDMTYEYSNRKVAEGIVRRYLKATFVASVEIEEF